MQHLEMEGWEGWLHAFWIPWQHLIILHGAMDFDTSMVFSIRI
jgi:hypothetical protein